MISRRIALRTDHRDRAVAPLFGRGDRRRAGVVLDKPIWENMAEVRSLAPARDWSQVSERSIRKRARKYMERCGIRARTRNQRAEILSGGNQRKLVLAKWLKAEPSVMLLDDPTRDVDVGTKADMHSLIRSLAKPDAVTVLRSNVLEGLLLVCDRLLIFYLRRICAELSGPALSQRNILLAMNPGFLGKAAWTLWDGAPAAVRQRSGWRGSRWHPRPVTDER
jgi:ABC-type sugar transport system ATPase subunit